MPYVILMVIIDLSFISVWLLRILLSFEIVEEFIRRVGFGNAVGLLHSKGVLSNIQQPARKNQAIA